MSALHTRAYSTYLCRLRPPQPRHTVGDGEHDLEMNLHQGGPLHHVVDLGFFFLMNDDHSHNTRDSQKNGTQKTTKKNV